MKKDEVALEICDGREETRFDYFRYSSFFFFFLFFSTLYGYVIFFLEGGGGVIAQ